MMEIRIPRGKAAKATAMYDLLRHLKAWGDPPKGPRLDEWLKRMDVKLDEDGNR